MTSNRAHMAACLAEATEELAGLRDAVERDPEAVVRALSRSVMVVGSAAMVLGCPETFD